MPTEKFTYDTTYYVSSSASTSISKRVQKDDSIDVWIGPYPENSALAEVERYEVVNYDITEAGYDIQIKSWKKFLVENWRGS
ncbi:unnamed protein product [Heligmosomoides polygyrus]|uniref:DUF4139 domain-containing protein n=1 Tax=Heligmosomoides polygyrus TaxID=6339 RepID=A0A183G390_HELPZ|nr:unnamed protein product [Heligmosomoides polygyrus]